MNLAYRSLLLCILSTLLYCAGTQKGLPADETGRLTELDGFWNELKLAVQEGDFERYKGTCHPLGVLVSGSKKTSYPLSKALAGWEQGFLDTKAGKMKAGVEFRFSQRIGDESTAHETGIFHYWTVDADGQRKDSYVHFEALLVKDQSWKTLMEYQKGAATQAEWNDLK